MNQENILCRVPILWELTWHHVSCQIINGKISYCSVVNENYEEVYEYSSIEEKERIESGENKLRTIVEKWVESGFYKSLDLSSYLEKMFGPVY
jgi:hypothetical protein